MENAKMTKLLFHKKVSAQVPFTGAGQDHDDLFAFIFRIGSKIKGCLDCSSG
jgi:hypothetical protein